MTTLEDNTARSRAEIAESLGRERLLEALASMMRIRRFEERAIASYQQTKVGGFLHLYSGQEAVAVGSCLALKDDDPMISAYRDHGHALARGMDPKYGMAELFGRIDGCAKGKGGSMHFFDREHHMYGGHAIVGGQLPLGVGIGFGIQYLAEDKVCACYLGDGALNQGAFHESMNLAALWRLPIVFVCENNLYSMGTHIARGTTKADDLSAKAHAYGMRYAELDGMDLLDAYDVLAREIPPTRGVSGQEGPIFVNARTYRYSGHSVSDPQKYRTKEEVAEFQQQDPITNLVRDLVDAGLASQDEIDQLDAAAKEEIREAVRFADASPAPGRDEMFTDVYAEPFPPYERGSLPSMLRDAGGAGSGGEGRNGDA